MSLGSRSGMAGFLAACAVLAMSGPASPQENIYEGAGIKEVTELTVDEYTRLALQESVRARISRHSLSGNTFNRQVTYIALRYPSLSWNAALGRSGSEGQTFKNNTNTYDTSLTYSQPIYVTGGSVSATLGHNESGTDSGGTLSFSGNKPRYNLSYSQPLFLFVKDPNKRTWRRTELSYQNSLDSYESERLEIVFGARDHYYRVLLKLAELGVEKKKLVSSREVYRVTQALVNAGKLAPIELNRSVIRYKGDERRLQNARVAYWQVLNDGKDRVGVPRDTVVVFTSTLTYTAFTATLERLIEYSYVHQPSIRSARRNVELAQISLREAQESTRPRFTLTSAWSLAETTGGTIADTRRDWNVQLGMAWPFFDSRRSYYVVLANRENLANTRLQLQATERDVATAVANFYVEIKRTEEQIQGFDVNRQQSLENVRIIKVRYRQGLDRLLDVFDAENVARDLDFEYLKLLFTFSNSVDSMSRLIGGDSRKSK